MAATEEAAPPPRRLVAIGDIHGELPNLQSILRHVGLMDEDGNWAGGDAVLVQTGDFLDRGPAVAEVMDLLMSLQESATEAGGEMQVLVGNHESMNLLRFLRDVGEEAMASFADEGSEARRRDAFRQWQEWLEVHTERLGGVPLGVAPIDEEEWMAAHPPGHLEYLEALGPESRYGRWLRSLSVVARAERTLLLHAGLGPAYAEIDAEEINRRFREAVKSFDAAWERLVELGIFLPSFTRSQAFDTLELYAMRSQELPPLPEEVRLAVDRGAAAFDGIRWLVAAESPLWYRGFANLPDQELQELLETLRKTHDVDRVVAAHTISRDGRIRPRLDGGLFLIDTGMLTSHYRGRPAALEILDAQVAAVYLDRRDLLVEAEVDPTPTEPAPTVSESSTVGVGGYEVPRRIWLGPDGEPLPFQTQEEAEEFLRTARIVSSETTDVGVTRPSRVLLERDGVQAHAIVHQVDTDKKRVRLDGGEFHMHFVDSYRAQIAAYEVSRLLGLQSVPPTVARDVWGKRSSVQLWIEQVVTEGARRDKGLERGPRAYLGHQVWDRLVFHSLLRNIDANQGNILWDAQGTIWLVDHTRTLAADPRPYRPDLLGRCSRELFEAIRALDPVEVEARMRPYMGRFEIDALLKRRDAIVELFEERIERLGEEQVLFDYGDPAGQVTVHYEDAA